MMVCFETRVFSQLVGRASIFEEIFRENIAVIVENMKGTFVPGTSSGGAGSGKRMDVISKPSQRPS
jgi:hypothetical protein